MLGVSSSLEPTCSICERECWDTARVGARGLLTRPSQQPPKFGVSRKPCFLVRFLSWLQMAGPWALQPSVPVFWDPEGSGHPALDQAPWWPGPNLCPSPYRKEGGFQGEMDSLYLLCSHPAQEWPDHCWAALGAPGFILETGLVK